MQNIVIKEIDIDFFSLFSANRLEQAQDEITEIIENSPQGDWFLNRNIKLTRTVLTNTAQQLHKVVLYATMSDMQVTEYVLRFE